MEINQDANTVVLSRAVYDELLDMSSYAIHENRSYEGVVRRITKHARRFNPQLLAEHLKAKEAEEKERKADRARLKALFKAGGKQIFYREDANTFWPVRLLKRMKYDWTFVSMVSDTEHRKFTSYEKQQSFRSFIIEGEVPLIRHHDKPGAYKKRLTQAERDADVEATLSKSFRREEPYNLRVTIAGSSLTVTKQYLSGPPADECDVDELKLYLRNIKVLMGDVVDPQFIADLHRIADETFGGGKDRHFRQLFVTQV